MKVRVPAAVSPEVISELREQVSRGVAREAMIASMRRKGLHIVESIKMYRMLFGTTLGEAKDAVHFSDTWADCRNANEMLHDVASTVLVEEGWVVDEQKASAA